MKPPIPKTVLQGGPSRGRFTFYFTGRWLDEMLDFKRTMAERLNTDHGQFKRSESYQLLHAGLVDRWNVLNEFGDYPHMLVPLSIA